MKRVHIFVVTGILVVLVLAVFGYWKIQADVESCAGCLPAQLKLSSELFNGWKNDYFPSKGKGSTVRYRLFILGAYCQEGVLYDRLGNQIVFLKLQCEGPHPTPKNDWHYRQQMELAKLKEQYTVITYCGCIP